ncbi:hypothetical protein Droror1_Dr00024807 [Drosera rotundifolia]
MGAAAETRSGGGGGGGGGRRRRRRRESSPIAGHKSAQFNGDSDESNSVGVVDNGNRDGGVDGYSVVNKSIGNGYQTDRNHANGVSYVRNGENDEGWFKKDIRDLEEMLSKLNPWLKNSCLIHVLIIKPWVGITSVMCSFVIPQPNSRNGMGFPGRRVGVYFCLRLILSNAEFLVVSEFVTC